MSDSMFSFGLLGTIVFSVWFIIAAVWKNPKRTPTIGLCISVILLFIGAGTSAEQEENISVISGLFLMILLFWGICKIVSIFIPGKKREKHESVHQEISIKEKTQTYQNYNENPKYGKEVTDALKEAEKETENFKVTRCSQICEDCATIIGTTTNINTFFYRYDLMIEKLDELLNTESVKSKTSDPPGILLQQVISSKGEEIDKFIDRCARKARAKINTLSTKSGKENTAESFKNELMEYQDKMTAENVEKILQEYQAMQALIEGEKEEPAPIQKRSNNFLKTPSGLYPYEVLMLSYLEKYCAGKEVARFWQYQYNVSNVFDVIESLTNKGFAKDGKLTELGKEEIAKNEWVMYMHRHNDMEVSMSDMCILVNKYPDKNYRELLLGKYQESAERYFRNKQYGLYRNEKYLMYRFQFEDGNYIEAFPLLLEVILYDLNGSNYPNISPALIKNLRAIMIKLDYEPEDATEITHELVARVYDSLPFKNYSSNDTIDIIVSYCFGDEEKALELLKKNSNYRY